jgi:dipeptidyl aminopeptidase/acylaminoacyl peptidase
VAFLFENAELALPQVSGANELRALLFSFWLSVSVPAVATPPAPLPVSDFAQLPFLRDPLLSPDGKHIAARLLVEDKVLVAIMQLDGASAKRRAVLNIEKSTIYGYQWAGNGKLLLSVLMTAPFFGVPIPVTSLVGYDLATGKMTALSREMRGLDNDNVIFADPNGSYALVSGQKLLFAQPSVFRVDLSTGDAKIVQPATLGIDQWFADADGTVRAGFAYDARRWKLFYRDTPDAKLRRIDSRDHRQDDSVIEGVRFMGNAGQGAVITDSKTGRFAAYRYDFASDSIGEPLFEHPSNDAAELIMSADGGQVEGVAYEDDRPRIAWLDPHRKELQARLDKALPAKLNRVMGMSADGGIVLFWSGAANDPGGYYLFDTKAKRIQTLVQPYDKVRPQNLSEVRPVSYTARDGTVIPGYLTLPHDRPHKNLPLVVMPHGGPFARDSWAYDPWAQMLADRGYAVLQPNFRGSTGYGRAYVEKGYGQWGLAMQDDLDDGMDWLVSQGLADPKRTCIMGASYGGYAALWGAIRNPERYRCAVSMAGVTDVRAMLKYDKKHFGAPRYARKWEARVEGEEKRDLDSVSPVQQAARMTVPVLIAHGVKDDNVPYVQATKLRDALKAAGKRFDFIDYPEAGHSFHKVEDSVDFMKRVEAFLATHNPA